MMEIFSMHFPSSVELHSVTVRPLRRVLIWVINEWAVRFDKARLASQQNFEGTLNVAIQIQHVMCQLRV